MWQSASYWLKKKQFSLLLFCSVNLLVLWETNASKTIICIIKMHLKILVLNTNDHPLWDDEYLEK